MKRNRNITQEALNEAWRQKQLKGEPSSIVFVDGIAWEHTDLSVDELAIEYNAVPIGDTLFGILYGWSKSDDNDVVARLCPNGTKPLEEFREWVHKMINEEDE